MDDLEPVQEDIECIEGECEWDQFVMVICLEFGHTPCIWVEIVEEIVSTVEGELQPSVSSNYCSIVMYKLAYRSFVRKCFG